MSSGSTRRGNRRGIDLVPGSVRAARQEAGLSLHEVAGAELTRGAIHLIEIGQARPSLKTLRLISARLGKPIEYFVPTGTVIPDEDAEASSLSALDRLATTSDFSALLASSTALAERAHDPYVRAAAHLHAARAASMLGDPSTALVHVNLAIAVAGPSKDDYSLANALAWQGAALLQLADARAPVVLNQALARARDLEPSSADLEARILTNLATWFVAKHSWDEAAAAFESAVRASEGTRDLARLARAYEGLAHVSEAQGQPDRAARLMERALAIYQMSSNFAAEVRTRASFAEVLIHQHRLSEAREQLEAASMLFEQSGLVTGKGRLRLLAAEIALAEGDLEKADAFLAEASSRISPSDDPVAQGELRRLEAIRAAGDPARYGALFVEAITIFDRAGLDQRARQVRTEYAQALESDGRIDEALAEWKAAAGVPAPIHRARRATGA